MKKQLLEGPGDDKPGKAQLAGLEGDNLAGLLKVERYLLLRRPEGEGDPRAGLVAAGKDAAIGGSEVGETIPAALHFQEAALRLLLDFVNVRRLQIARAEFFAVPSGLRLPSRLPPE